MTPDDDLPRPLQGPVDLRTLFLLNSISPYSFERTRPRRTMLIFAGLGIAMAPLFWYLISKAGPGSFGSEDIWGLLIVVLVFTEAIPLALAFFASQAAASQWQNANRLPELVLTPLRPITISQLILAPVLRPWSCFLGGALAGGMYCFAAQFPRHLALLPILFLIGLHAFICLYANAWICLVLRLGVGPLGRIWGFGMHLVTYGLFIGGFGVVLLVSFLGLWNFGYLQSADTWPWALTRIAIGFSALFFIVAWLARYLFTRAFVINLERIVFPKMDL